ncbi:small RNA degrading nuclease 3-like [Pistacia vera]|uniref:small RNA degrading nuclease 3-like n=1 Tax=Pistacia vera TaxID=55513 RepID=UPI001263D5D1|nr:small RNA degrading nuclease 3 isoform X1 [Pistacia vera]XP_031282527.1 small RNA degrading nuclease 3-like [Pistacia vera]
MDQKLEILEKKVLVGIVKMVQKQGMQGTAGGWKDFLNSYDKKFGSSLSDPAKRSNDVLVSFLKTFTKEDDLKFIAKVLQRHQNRYILELYEKKSPDDESPEQRLVRLTLQHPQYALDYMFPSCNEEWVVTKLGDKSKAMTSNTMYAVDCEMVLCEDGSEALVRVCVVDRNLEVKLDELVNPNKAVADYRSEITGVTAEDLVGVTCSLAEIQKRMKKLLSHGIILVGHSLNNDLHALKVDHPRVIDTSLIFKYADGNRRPSLNNLCKSVLGYEIRKNGAPHDCLDDACAAMKLVLAVIERGVDNAMTIVQEDVAEIDKAKLLLHRIPVNVPCEELHRVIPGDFTIEVKTSKRGQGDKYSAVAIFSSPQEACQAFENVEGSQEKDSSGRGQKLVKFQTSKGVTASLYVRKMARDVPLGQFLVKRALEGEENSGVSKKQKIEQTNKEIVAASNECKCKEHLKEIERLRKMVDSNQCDDHLKEIESLKQELREKDFQISTQDKMISILKKKVEMKNDKKNKRR